MLRSITPKRKLAMPMTRVVRRLTSCAAKSVTSPNWAPESRILWRMAGLAENVASLLRTRLTVEEVTPHSLATWARVGWLCTGRFLATRRRW